jgi:hypothetical protein
MRYLFLLLTLAAVMATAVSCDNPFEPAPAKAYKKYFAEQLQNDPEFRDENTTELKKEMRKSKVKIKSCNVNGDNAAIVATELSMERQPMGRPRWIESTHSVQLQKQNGEWAVLSDEITGDKEVGKYNP